MFYLKDLKKYRPDHFFGISLKCFFQAGDVWSRLSTSFIAMVTQFNASFLRSIPSFLSFSTFILGRQSYCFLVYAYTPSGYVGEKEPFR